MLFQRPGFLLMPFRKNLDQPSDIGRLDQVVVLAIPVPFHPQLDAVHLHWFAAIRLRHQKSPTWAL